MHKNSNSDSGNKKMRWGKTLTSNYRLVFLFFIIILFFVLCSVLYLLNNQNKEANIKNAEYQKSIQKQVKITNTENVNDVVKVYGKEKDSYTKELQGTSSASWDKAKLDKVYFNLLYADKVGSFSDVYAMLAFINAAERSGLNVDDNSYGINQKIRNEIKLRADRIVEARMKGTTK